MIEFIEVGNQPTYADCTVLDNSNESLSCSMDDTDVDITIPGIYTIEYTVEDSSHNESVAYYIIVVEDKEAPIIDVDSTPNTFDTSITSMDDYLPTCTVTDNVDTNLECIFSDIYISYGIPGTYYLVVTAMDSSNNMSDIELIEVLIIEGE
jgi:hypothetical protein